jgi:hypothetical protein
MIAEVKHSVSLLGTSLFLLHGTKVVLTEATNLPPGKNGKRYFARPADGIWWDKIERNEDDSILLEEEDLIFHP